MIKKLYEAGCFDYQRFILNNIKTLSLSSDEAIVLIKIVENYSKTKILSSDELASQLAYPSSKIDQALTRLLERNYYEIYINYDNGVGQEYISIDGFFDKVEAVLNNSLVNLEDELFSANQYLARQLNRILTAKEIEILTSLIREDRYTLKDIENACESLRSKKKLITMKNLAQAIVIKEDVVNPSPNPSSTIVKDFFKSIK